MVFMKLSNINIDLYYIEHLDKVMYMWW
jgi:hypothetical protein